MLLQVPDKGSSALVMALDAHDDQDLPSLFTRIATKVKAGLKVKEKEKSSAPKKDPPGDPSFRKHPPAPGGGKKQPQRKSWYNNNRQ